MNINYDDFREVFRDLEERTRDYRSTGSEWVRNLNEWRKRLQKPSANDIQLGIWGVSGSGKTTYMLMLYYALRNSDEWIIELDPSARKFVKENGERMKNGFFPYPTEVNKRIDVFSYILTPRNCPNVGKKIILKFIDAPGESYQNILTATGKVKSRNTANNNYGREEELFLIEYLMSCDGILFLLDPDGQQNHAYSTLLEELFNEFQERRRNSNQEIKDPRLEQYIAFCVSKIDNPQFWYYRNQPELLVERLLGKWMTLKNLQSFCRLNLDAYKTQKPHRNNRCNFFCASSVGCYQQDGEWVSPVINPQENNVPPSPSESLENNSQYRVIWSHEEDDYTVNKPNNSEDWASPRNQNIPPQEPVNMATIDSEAPLEPWNILNPIEWLIEGVKNHPPSRTH